MVERRNEAGLKVGENQRHRGWVSMHSLALDKAVIFGEREREMQVPKKGTLNGKCRRPPWIAH